MDSIAILKATGFSGTMSNGFYILIDNNRVAGGILD
jgi:hypothetical protein